LILNDDFQLFLHNKIEKIIQFNTTNISLISLTMFKVSVSESCTGGNIQKQITAKSGVSQWFRGGVCAYDIIIKEKLLGVPIHVSQPCNCVGPEVASMMAIGTNQLFDSCISVSTTGYVNSTKNINHPYCFMSIATPFGCETKLFETENDERLIVQNKMAKAAIKMMLDVYIAYKDKFMKIYNESTLNHFEGVLTTIIDE